MAFNKLRIFELVRYTRILWLDSDSLVLHNVDHLLQLPESEPGFYAPVRQECHSLDGAGKISGSVWALRPAWDESHRLRDLFSSPIPGTKPPKGWEKDLDVRAQELTTCSPPRANPLAACRSSCTPLLPPCPQSKRAHSRCRTPRIDGKVLCPDCVILSPTLQAFLMRR